MDVGYAVSHGIIDQANGQYVGLGHDGQEQRLPVSEAIKKGKPNLTAFRYILVSKCTTQNGNESFQLNSLIYLLQV